MIFILINSDKYLTLQTKNSIFLTSKKRKKKTKDTIVTIIPLIKNIINS